MSYRVNLRNYNQTKNKTELQIVQDYPYTVLTREIEGNLLDYTEQEQIEEVLKLVAVEFNPSYAIQQLNQTVTLVQEDLHAQVFKLQEEINTEKDKLNTVLKSVIHVDSLTDDQKDEIIRQFDVWQPNTDYPAYTVINYEGTLYEIIQAHRSQDDWRPDNTPALYAEYLNITITDPDTGEETEIISDWKQPAGEHDAYSIGDKVRFNGEVYQSNRDGNVWSPADLPSGWDLVEEVSS